MVEKEYFIIITPVNIFTNCDEEKVLFLKGRNLLNLELLQVGTKVKYPILCQAFGETPKTGNSKPKQLKEFEKYVKFEKQGTWFHILEIYVQKDFCTSATPVNNIYNWDNECTKKSEDTEYLRKRLKEELNMPLEESSLSVYNAIISQIEGKTLKQLIAKSIINQLYLQLSRIGQVGFMEAWWVTDSELYQATGMVSNSYFYATRNPERFCEKVKDLDSSCLDEVLDHMGVDKEWLKSQRASVLKYLTNDLHLISHTDKAYYFEMRTTRIKHGVAYTDIEMYYPTLDEIEWINTKVIPEVMKKHTDKHGNYYTSLNKVMADGKIREFYQEWIPNYINQNLPTGWGYVTGVQKCHRIGFAPDVIEFAVKNQMRLLVQENEILDNIAYSLTNEVKGGITDNRNEQSEKRHRQAIKGTSRAKNEVKKIRCLDSYIGVGYAVNRELHSEYATYKDFTRRTVKSSTASIVSKVQE